MLDLYDLYYAHEIWCTRKYVQLNKLEIVKKNLVSCDGDLVEYDAYCPCCGILLYHFSWGKLSC